MDKRVRRGGSVVGGGIALGYDWGAIRLEGKYLHRATVYDDTADLDVFDDVSPDKREQEIELAGGGIDDWQSHGAFVNVYYDFALASSS